MVASAADRPTLEAGAIGFGPTKDMPFPPIRVDRVVGEEDTVLLGGVALTAQLTPGHTQGCTSWSMAVRGADGVPHTALFHCSTTVAGQSLVPESWPGMIAAYRSTFAKLRAIRADVFLAAHGNFFGLEAKRARQRAGDADAFVDPGALRQLNDEMERAFEAELARQKGAAH
jgi:metallo-beta-lactamase class B